MRLDGNIKKILFFGVASAFLCSSSYAEPLTLDLAIRRGMLNDRLVRERRLQLKFDESIYDDAWARMYMPTAQIELNSNPLGNLNPLFYNPYLNTNGDYTLAQMPGSQAAQTGSNAYSHGFPTTIATLNFGSYTVFNFWRDWLVYEAARLTYERSQQQLTEYERSIRFQIIIAYFTLKTDQEKLEAAKRSIDIADAIVSLVKSRLKLGQANERDLSSSTVDLLTAKNFYNDLSRTVKGDLWNLDLLLGDPIDTPYQLGTELKYRLLKIGPEEALRVYMTRSPDIRDARLDLRKTELAEELANKNRLPLPTIGFSGATLSYMNSYYGGQTIPGSDSRGVFGNLDISATISLTIPIVGPGGLFNQREVDRAHYRRDISEINYQQIGNQDQAKLFSLIAFIKSEEQTIANLRDAFQKDAALLDSLFSQESSSSVSRLDLRDAVNQARDSEFTLKDTVLDHLRNKLQVADLVGMDYLPGDIY